MTSKMHLATRKVGLALVAALLAQTGIAATEDTAKAPLPELDEVWVHGQSLVQRIETAEDRAAARAHRLVSGNLP